MWASLDPCKIVPWAKNFPVLLGGNVAFSAFLAHHTPCLLILSLCVYLSPKWKKQSSLSLKTIKMEQIKTKIEMENEVS